MYGKKPDRRLRVGVRGVSKFPIPNTGSKVEESNSFGSQPSPLSNAHFDDKEGLLTAEQVLEKYKAPPPGGDEEKQEAMQFEAEVFENQHKKVDRRTEIMKLQNLGRKPPKEIKRIKKMRQSLSDSMLRKGYIRESSNNNILGTKSKLKETLSRSKSKKNKEKKDSNAISHNNVRKRYTNIAAFDRTFPEQQVSMLYLYNKQLMKLATGVKPFPNDPRNSSRPSSNQSKDGHKNGQKRNRPRRWKNKNRKAADDAVANTTKLRSKRMSQVIFKQALATLNTSVHNADTEAQRVAKLVRDDDDDMPPGSPPPRRGSRVHMPLGRDLILSDDTNSTFLNPPDSETFIRPGNNVDDVLPMFIEVPNAVLSDNRFLRLDQSRIQLHLFDDPDAWEQIPVEERVENCNHAWSPFYDQTGEWVWKSCTVLRYVKSSEEEQKNDDDNFDAFSNNMDNNNNNNNNKKQNPGYFVIRFNCNQREKPVQRLNLLFANESKAHFRRRLRAALKLREETKAAVRLEHLLDTLTATALAHSQQQQQQRPASASTDVQQEPIFGNNTKRGLISSVLGPDFGEMKNEYSDFDIDCIPEEALEAIFARASIQPNVRAAQQIDESYRYGLRRAVLFQIAKSKRSFRKQYAKMRLPKLIVNPGRPYFGQICVWPTQGQKRIVLAGQQSEFEERRDQVAALHYTRSQGVFNLITFLYDTFDEKLSGIVFVDVLLSNNRKYLGTYDPHIALPLCKTDLVLLNEVQERQQRRVDSKLQNEWRQGLLSRLMDEDIMNEFDTLSSDFSSFERSSLAGLCRMLRLRMATLLHELVVNSCDAWEELINRFSIMECGSHILENAGAGDANKATGSDSCTSASLFQVDLYVDPLDGQVKMDPSQEDLQKLLEQPIEQMVHLVSMIETLERSVLTLLDLPKRNILPLSSPLEPTKTNSENDAGKNYASNKASVSANWGVDDGYLAELTRTKLAKTRESIAAALKTSFACVEKVVEKYQSSAHFALMDPVDYLEQLEIDYENESGDKMLEEFQKKVVYFDEASKQVLTLSYVHEPCGVVRVSCKRIKESLSDTTSALARTISESLQDNIRAHSHEIRAIFEDMYERINMRPRNEQELIDQREFVGNYPTNVAQLREKTAQIHSELETLQTLQMPIDQVDFFDAWNLKIWPSKIERAAQESMGLLDEERLVMLDELALEQQEFEEFVLSLDERISEFSNVGEYDQVFVVYETCRELQDDIDAARRKMDDFIRRETLFGFRPSEYLQVEKCTTDFEPNRLLWTMAYEFSVDTEKWLTGNFMKLDAVAIVQQVNHVQKKCLELQKTFQKSNKDEALQVVVDLRARVKNFAINVPLIEALATRALQPRHWESISALFGTKIAAGDGLMLQNLLDMNALSSMDQLFDIATVARKEFGLQRALEAMLEEWTPIDFEVMTYKDTFIIKFPEELFQLLDDHVTKTQMMMGSPFVQSVQQALAEWELKLHGLSALLDEWTSYQRTWMYLEPIFGSEDIMRQMPVEGRRFQSVDILWRKSMARIQEQPSVLDVLQVAGLTDTFRQANERLEIIQKGLTDYLETKRLLFPRFFFLSNDELLEILSQTKDPRAVQPHLSKCFEGIADVRFSTPPPAPAVAEIQTDKSKEANDDTVAEVSVTVPTPDGSDLHIQAIISGEGEVVVLQNPVYVNKGNARGNVEVWLLDLESSMRLSIKQQTSRSIEDYPATERRTMIAGEGEENPNEEQSERCSWILKWPGMVSLCTSCIFWTRQVCEAIDRNALGEYEQQLTCQLQDVVELVRGDLNKLQRISIGALCVVDVHARDVVAALHTANVTDPRDFEWMAQMRYYWEDHPDEYLRYGKIPTNVVVRIVNSAQLYAYEYLGTTSRLVITPLTDRCYRTMMGAVALMYGGAPEGPAGTGKTETVKDLSKAVAIQCVVFNCSDGLDYLAMAKFFKGLASSGAWCCFDEFNRIDLEVLSVIAQQILTMQQAKVGHVKRFYFEGSDIKLNPDCNTFITMNPGYAGRSELPDNLKALFRPCAMMVPDYAMIAEIKLYSFGFSNARVLANKIAQVLRLSSEQLSSQKHYDYGMRAVFSILVRAGNLRQMVKWAEDLVVLSAINDVNLPKFTTNDLPLFTGITQDLFPGINLPSAEHSGLLDAIDSELESKQLVAKEEFVRSVVQLYETVSVRHGLMLVGEAMSGKTTTIHTLRDALTRWDQPVLTHTMNPKSVTLGQLYGNFDPNTHEWTDGVLAVTYRACARDLSGTRNWIVFDGPVDAVWIESMNTVLDENKKLCLPSGEIVKMAPTTTMMFETEDLEEASPATVSRVGMVFLEAKRLGIAPLVTSFLSRSGYMCEMVDHVQRLCDWLLPPLLFWVDKTCIFSLPISQMQFTISILRLFDALCTDAKMVVQEYLVSYRAPADKKTKSKSSRSIDNNKNASGKSVGKNTKKGGKSGGEKSMKKMKRSGTNRNMKRTMSTKSILDTARSNGTTADNGDVTNDSDNESEFGGSQITAAGEKPQENEKEKRKETADNEDEESDLLILPFTLIDELFFEAVVWSVGATMEEGQRVPFNAMLQVLLLDPELVMTNDSTYSLFSKKHPEYHADMTLIELHPRTSTDTAGIAEANWRPPLGLPSVMPEPSEFSIFAKRFNVSEAKWVPWQNDQEKLHIPQNVRFHSILIPTPELVQNMHVISTLLRSGRPVLCTGHTGTGKTSTVKTILSHNLNDQDSNSKPIQMLQLTFSARTSVNGTQDIMDRAFVKRRKGIFGPPLGTKMFIFVDDLNMPQKEEYGAQPPIELLRQWMDHSGWFDRKTIAFRSIEDTHLVCAMGHPGGGRSSITQRMSRHFNVVNFVPMGSDSLELVFGTIMNWFLDDRPSAIKQTGISIVEAATDLFLKFQELLRPTPLKSHYTFNLRDIGSVFLGIVHMGSNGLLPNTLSAPDTKSALIKLWGHESMRVFSDRLIDVQDKSVFTKLLTEMSQKHLDVDWKGLIHGDALIYGAFDGPVEVVGHRTYASLRLVMNSKVEEYNGMSGVDTMDLVFFADALYHLARVSRVINLPHGNALLVGVGGSGRKSLCKLAAFASGLDVIQLEVSKAYGINEWHEDVKNVLRKAGKGEPTVFLLSDTQIIHESFVEDINNILNSGQVPNLFAPEEVAEILHTIKNLNSEKTTGNRGKKDTATAVTWGDFVELCKDNLHVVLAFSPVGDDFRTRLRMFPSLTNCCTIDWYSAWPKDALVAVAESYLCEVNDVQTKSIVDVCVGMQKSATQLSSRYLSEQRRHYYITPTSFLELLGTFLRLVSQQRDTVQLKKHRYENGLAKLKETADQVAVMQEELEALQPQLAASKVETEAMLVKIGVMQIEAGKTREVVTAEEKACGLQAAEARAIKEDCERDLDQAIPVLEAAILALSTLSKSDISEIKSMKKPPDGVKLTMEACCIMLQVPPARIPNPAGKGKINDYWVKAQKELLGDPRFLSRLLDFDKDNMPEDLIEHVKIYTEDPEFTPEVVKRASTAAAGICKWVHAMVVYDRLAKIVRPKREALKLANGKLEVAQEMLAEKQAQLNEVESMLASLQTDLLRTTSEKEELERQKEDCIVRLDRAERLIHGLGGEKVRWTAAAERLHQQQGGIVGDVLLASGIIAYLGSFSGAYRSSAVKEWSKLLQKSNISFSDGSNLQSDFSLANTLSDAVKIRSWTINKLPNDAFSIDNAVAVENSSRWPLMIDPQGQANKWIRCMESEHELVVCRPSDSNMLRALEGAIQSGRPFLLENVTEALDPVLENLLHKRLTHIGTSSMIQLGDNTVEYDMDFRFYMTTRLSNPHFPPEACAKLNLLNFMATQRGLEDQMLGIVVTEENPDLEQQREQLIIQDAENKRKLSEIEDRILGLLSHSGGNLLDDEAAIDALSESKTTSKTIMVQVEKAAKTQAVIRNARTAYQPVAFRASLMFFCIAELFQIDPMYQYSLDWYVGLFKLSIARTEKSGNKSEHFTALRDNFTYALYENVCRSLFEKDKLLFSFQLCTQIMIGDGTLSRQLLRVLLQGTSALELSEPNPATYTPGATSQAASKVTSTGDKGTNAGISVGGDASEEQQPVSEHSWFTDRIWANVLGLCEMLGGMNGKDEEKDKIKTSKNKRKTDNKEMEKNEITEEEQQEQENRKHRAGQELLINFRKNLRKWKPIFESVDPWTDIVELVPDAEDFVYLALVRFLRPDKFVDAVQRFVTMQLGARFTDPPQLNLETSFGDSTCLTPFLFVLTPGADPMAELTKLAIKKGQRDHMVSVSLGQGQGPIAENAISLAIDKGTWVVLQNVHLAESWMPVLEEICESITEERAQPTFRLWLTSMPSNAFPVSILQNGIKMTNEPPKGLRANMLNSMGTIDASWFESCARSKDFKRLLFALCLFHASIIERKRYGPLGWNTPYEFSPQDLRISMDQLHLFLSETVRPMSEEELAVKRALELEDGQDEDEEEANKRRSKSSDVIYGVIPFDALRYLVGECNYGGRVTDDKDRRCLLSTLEAFYSESVVHKFPKNEGEFSFDKQKMYSLPSSVPGGGADGGAGAVAHAVEEDTGPDLKTHLAAVQEFPINAPPGVLGLHENAAIISALQETGSLLGAAMNLQPRAAGSGGNAASEWDSAVGALARDVLGRIPQPFDVERVEICFPTMYEESMNTVLTQELMRYNYLINVLRMSLLQIQRAIKGDVILSGDLEAMGDAMIRGQVPDMWAAAAYPSLKPLGTWVSDLALRLEGFSKWITNGTPPPAFWISGFFFTQGFLTGTLQNYARRHQLPIDTLHFDYQVLPLNRNVNTIDEAPDKGAYIYGLFLDGAGWRGGDEVEEQQENIAEGEAPGGHLDEPKPRELQTPMRSIWLKPVTMTMTDMGQKSEKNRYMCPCYKTSQRWGVLSTTGHSNNFVMMVGLPLGSDQNAKHWVKRGVALLTQLDN